jgi:putative NIF3 family GTP cyclohydrolase 1 type 2
MTGGTSGPDKMFARLSQTGVKTLVGMHCKESGYKAAKTEFINYVIAGHIASDTLGLNLLFDAVEKKGKLKFITCSGFKRTRRK